jgi:hypothetical protein
MSLRLAHALIPHEINTYWQALGQFVSAFSTVEVAMQIALRRLAHVRDPIGAALFSGTRTEAAAQYIRRIAEAEKWNERRKGEIESVFGQLRLINEVRNDLLHYGTRFEGAGRFSVSTATVAHTKNRVRKTTVSPAILEEMAGDLEKIEIHMLVLSRRRGERVHPTLQTILRASWQYKPPPARQPRSDESSRSKGRNRRPGRVPTRQPKA